MQPSRETVLTVEQLVQHGLITRWNPWCVLNPADLIHPGGHQAEWPISDFCIVLDLCLTSRKQMWKMIHR